MANKLYEESSVSAIADAIRALNGTSNTYTIAQMAPAIKAIIPSTMSFAHSTFSTFPVPWTFASRTSCKSMFTRCTSLTTAPLFDTSSVTNMDGMFEYCEALTNVPAYNTGSVTTMDGMFSHCYALQSIPLFDTSNVTNMNSMFWYCTSLTSVPALNTSEVTITGGMFLYCTALVSAPSLDTSHSVDFSSMFSDCSSLTTVPVYNMSSLQQNGLYFMFSGCDSLSNTSLQNILKSLLTAPTNTSPKNLAYIGLTSAQATTCSGFSEWSTLASRGWTLDWPN